MLILKTAVNSQEELDILIEKYRGYEKNLDRVDFEITSNLNKEVSNKDIQEIKEGMAKIEALIMLLINMNKQDNNLENNNKGEK